MRSSLEMRLRSILVTAVLWFGVGCGTSKTGAEQDASPSADSGPATDAVPSIDSGAPADASTSTASAPIRYVQGASAGSNGASASIAQSFPSNTAAGDLIVVVVSWDTGSSSVVTIADSEGNAYSQAAQAVDATHTQALAIYYASNIAAGTDRVTASFGASSGSLRLAIHEYAGIAAMSAFDATAMHVDNTGTAAPNGVTSNAAVSLSDGELVFGAVMADHGPVAIAAGSGFSVRESASTSDLSTEDRIQAAAGSIAATFTFAAAESYLAEVVTFKSAGPAPPPDTVAPTTPLNLTATAVSTSEIDLAWAASTDNVSVAGYRVFRGGTQIATTASNRYSDISGLAPSTMYTYTVAAFDAAGNVSPPSGAASATTLAPGPITAPLRSLASNPNYFTDGTGKAVYLTGSQTWNSLQDHGTGGVVQPIDFTAFVNVLTAHHHNFTLLWYVELATYCGLPTLASNPPSFAVSPHPWQRTGPGIATDGGLKFDFTRFNQTYFDRLRARVAQLGNAGIYAGVYVFTAEFINAYRCSGDGYPYSSGNNVNGIADDNGTSSVTMTAPNAITAIQDAYVEKLIDTLNDLPNVLWMISEEAPTNSVWWNQHQIAHIHAYEAGKPLQHPVGWATLTGSGNDAQLDSSDADWVAPIARISPTTSCGSGNPACKVNINDSDHSYFGMWNDSAQTNRGFIWENFTNGNQVLFMDPYLLYYPRENRNLCSNPVNGICATPDARWDPFRDSMGHARQYADRMGLAAMRPHANLASTGYCLSSASEYLVYAPNGGTFTVNLSATAGALKVEWLNPATGAKTTGAPVTGGASSQTFSPPFSGDAVLYLAP
jgi:chitodextrinase